MNLLIRVMGLTPSKTKKYKRLRINHFSDFSVDKTSAVPQVMSLQISDWA